MAASSRMRVRRRAPRGYLARACTDGGGRSRSSEEVAMHDIDRTQLEWQEYGPSASEQEHEWGEREMSLGETRELELASELLEVTSEQELEQFLGNLFRAVGTAAGRFA